MKNCVKCSYALDDKIRFCPVCGTEQPYLQEVNCSNCGCKLVEEARFCYKCGKPVSTAELQQLLKGQTPYWIAAICERTTIVSVLWMIVGIIQLLIGVLELCIGLFVSSWSAGSIFVTVMLLLIGIYNIFSSTRIFGSRNEMLRNYTGIVSKNSFRIAIFFNYFYNIFVIILTFAIEPNALTIPVALISLAALLVDFFGIKLFVREHREDFLQLEKLFTLSSGKQERKPILPADPNSQYFDIYADFTAEQLKDVVDNPEQYNDEAYRVANALYEERVKPESTVD
jgi:Uncharacterized conserved protein